MSLRQAITFSSTALARVRTSASRVVTSARTPVASERNNVTADAKQNEYRVWFISELLEVARTGRVAPSSGPSPAVGLSLTVRPRREHGEWLPSWATPEKQALLDRPVFRSPWVRHATGDSLYLHALFP